MPWLSILTLWALALTSAWLVYARDWEPWQAAMTVGISALIIILGLITLLLVCAFVSGGRSHVLKEWNGLTKTMKDDFRLLLEQLGFKKKRG